MYNIEKLNYCIIMSTQYWQPLCNKLPLRTCLPTLVHAFYLCALQRWSNISSGRIMVVDFWYRSKSDALRYIQSYIDAFFSSSMGGSVVP